MLISNEEKIRIKEYVSGVFTGISVACNGNATASEILGDDHWFSWSDNLDVNLVEDEEGDWSCAVYPVVDGQTDGTQWVNINLD